MAETPTDRPAPPPPHPEGRAPDAPLIGDSRRDGSPRLKLWSVVALALVLAGVSGSLVGARVVADGRATTSRLVFRSAAAEVASSLELVLQHEQDLNVAAAAYVASNPNGSQAQFRAWTTSVGALARYPELEGIGFARIVPASQLAAFASHAASPLTVLPAGKRPFYCLGVLGQSRAVLGAPTGLDYCAIDPDLYASRASGRGAYIALTIAFGETWLAIEQPVYRGGGVPATVQARRRAFLGWVGEVIEPGTVLRRALHGQSGKSVILSYQRKGAAAVSFSDGLAPKTPESATTDLGDGWTLTLLGSRPPSGMLRDSSALLVLLGGSALSLLLGALVFVLAAERVRALRLVDQKTRQLSHHALHDALTGLPNRMLVIDRAEQLLARNRRQPGAVPAALFIDIDGFKDVNDTYGHAAGDHVLTVIAERLTQCLRKNDTVGRIGGDEFVALLESTWPDAPPTLIATRMIEELEQPIEIPSQGRSVTVTASIGIALGQRDAADELLRDADFALYEAKTLGKDRYALFEPRMHTATQNRLELEADLGQALEREQFFLLYQPTFDLQTEELLGFEALVRWQHPTRGVIEPDAFIPVAEQTGHIAAIGRWVLFEACQQLAAWQLAGRALGISVNISAHQLERDGLADDVQHALAESGIDPGSLTLEIAETVLMHDLHATARKLGELKQLGVKLTIDNFGTGYSSLANLREFPIDALKIDRSFIANVSISHEAPAIIRSLIRLGKLLRLETLAEGIEDNHQLRSLRREHCDQGQGFLFAHPLTVEAASDLLETTERAAQHVTV